MVDHRLLALIFVQVVAIRNWVLFSFYDLLILTVQFYKFVFLYYIMYSWNLYIVEAWNFRSLLLPNYRIN